MLTFAEEIMLLAIDEKSGLIRPLPERSLDFAITGALLLELALNKKIDTDTKSLHVITYSGIKNPLLKSFISSLPKGHFEIPLEDAIRTLAAKGNTWKRKVIDSLIAKNMVKRRRLTVFFFIKRRSYPITDLQTLEQMRARIRRIVEISEEIPSPNEAALVSLMNACALWRAIFSEDEFEKYRDRIDEISKMNLISLQVARCILEIQAAINGAMALGGV